MTELRKPGNSRAFFVRAAGVFAMGVLMTFLFLFFRNASPPELSGLSPLTLLSNSMEPTLKAPRSTLTCPHCKASFDFLVNFSPVKAPIGSGNVLSAIPPQRILPCPTCGFTAVPVNGGTLRVTAVKVYQPRLFPKRYEPVVYLNDDDLCVVKRLIGLPVEQIEIRSGDIYVNGSILVKTSAEAKEQAVPLASIDRVDERNLIRFIHRKPIPWDDPAERKKIKLIFPVTNDCETPTVGQVARNVEFVRDFILSFDWVGNASNLPGPVITYHDGSRRYRVTIGSLSRTTRIDLICCDRQIQVLLDGKTVCTKQLPESSRFEPVTEPFTIQASNGQVKDAVVARDIHYSSVPDGPNLFNVPQGEYFLLGDNSPVSFDGRFGTPLAVPYRNLIGFVKPSDGVVSDFTFEPQEAKAKNHGTP